jgi:hypothetical protein
MLVVRLIRIGGRPDGRPLDGNDAAARYSTMSTIRRVRGSTSTVRPFTTV